MPESISITTVGDLLAALATIDPSKEIRLSVWMNQNHPPTIYDELKLYDGYNTITLESEHEAEGIIFPNA